MDNDGLTVLVGRLELIEDAITYIAFKTGLADELTANITSLRGTMQDEEIAAAGLPGMFSLVRKLRAFASALATPPAPESTQ